MQVQNGTPQSPMTASHHVDPRLRSKVVTIALYSRLTVVALAAICDLVVPNHDAGSFTWTPSTSGGAWSPTLCDRLVSLICDGLTLRWDGQYFLHIADNGYTYENTLAFFPLYPLFIRTFAAVIYWLQVDYSLMHFTSALKLSSVLVNIGAFVIAAVMLHELSRKVLHDEYLAYKSVLYFCFNPASIFFSAAYSESLHAAVSFALMLRVEKGFSFRLAVLLAFATAIRSNGVISLGFVGYKCLKMIAKELAIHRRLVQLGQGEISTTIANILGDAVLPTTFSIVAAAIPFGFYQWYGFTQFCGLTKPTMNYPESIISYAETHNLKLPSTTPKSPWCLEEGSENMVQSMLPPISYSYIQVHYWDQGFLRYYQFKQIPQFVLAAPILSFVFYQAWRFCCAKDHHRYYCSRLGLTHFGMDPAQRVPPFDHYGKKGLPRECFVYVVHAAVLSAFCLLFIHVQVSTRLLLSSCPVIYWWVAMWTTPQKSNDPNQIRWPRATGSTFATSDEALAAAINREVTQENWWRNLAFDERINLDDCGQWIQNYFAGYAFIGILLFVNHLPWT